MALASWMNNKESRAAKMKKILAREQTEPLMIKVEQLDHMALINTHNLITNDPHLAPRYLAAQEQAISHFEDMFRLLWDDITHACLRRWNIFHTT